MNEAPWDALVARLAGHSLRDLVVAACYLAVPVFVAADLWIQHRRAPGTGARAREVRTAAAMAAGALAIGVAYSAAFVAAFALVSHVAPHPGLADSHPIVAFAVAFVAWDLIGWLYHLIGHTSAVGWASHQAHHTGRTFDGSLALRQSWFPVHGLAVQPLIALTGVDLAVVVVCIAVSNVVQALQHSASLGRVPRWVAAVVVTPEAHRHHHRTGAGPVNLGPVFTVWDRMAGTWRAGPVPDGATYGERGPGDRGALAAVGSGWAQILRRPLVGDGTRATRP